MDKGKSIELVKGALAEIPHLRELHYDNQEFKLWRSKVETIIKAGLNKEDYDTFQSARLSSFPMRGIASENSFKEHYWEELTSYETALKSIIQKYELLGFETESTEPPKAAEDSKKEKPSIYLDK